MTAPVPATFEPAGITVWVAPGTTVLDAARSAGVVIAAPCGGRGVCGACGVRVVSGALGVADEQELAGLERARPGTRLACRARIIGPASVRPIAVGVMESEARLPGAACTTLVAGVDLGTTSIAVALIDPASGLEVARASVANPQATYGSDVLSRLSAASAGYSAQLRALAEQGVAAALDVACAACQGEGGTVERLVVAGNTAMVALLAGVEVGSLAVAPFCAPQVPHRLEPGPELARHLVAGVGVDVLPPIAGFVGGDALAASLAAGMLQADSPVLLVDFGTNAEIVLATGDDGGDGDARYRLTVASAAAGPAFEGSGISCGGPAAPGAVTEVRVDADGSVSLTTMGGGEPEWFSGSGLVSAIAALRRTGNIDASGLMTSTGALAQRFGMDTQGVLTVSLGDEGSALTITQLDVRALQLAKAAVQVGVRAVLRSAGLGAADLSRVGVAGAFGSALDPQDLIELGILPMGTADKADRIGNAALDGASVVALDPGVTDMVRAAGADAHHVELARLDGFNDQLMDATALIPYEV